MPRRRRPREIVFNFDSFLDLVANVVGIIIKLILVAWVGAKTYTGLTTPRPTPSPPEVSSSMTEPLPSTHREEDELEEVRRLLARARADLAAQLEREKQVERRQADATPRLAALGERRKELEQREAALAARGHRLEKEGREARLTVDELREKARRLAAEAAELRQSPLPPKVLRYQTPVAEIVQTEELQFECKGGRITFLDVEAFLREVRRGLREKGERLRSRWKVEEETEVIGAFRLRYVVVRERGLLDAVAGADSPDARANFRYGLEGWEAVPVAQKRGETVEDALRPDSQFRRIIDRLDPEQTAVTLWVYPDSFALYRAVRDYCVKRGILVAGRPLPEDVPIASSRHGTASRGQ